MSLTPGPGIERQGHIGGRQALSPLRQPCSPKELFLAAIHGEREISLASTLFCTYILKFQYKLIKRKRKKDT